MKEKAKAMVLASFAADSLALGAHWIYDTAVIERTVGRVDRLLDPPADGFHPSRKKGDFTHYGDQTLVLLEAISAAGRFDPAGFAGAWRNLFDGYSGYVDHATRETLERFRAGNGPERSGSGSSDMGGAARIAPLAYLLRDDPEALADAAEFQTAMTHDHPLVRRAARFLSLVLCRVLRGERPTEAIASTLEERFEKGDFGDLVRRGLDSAGRPTVEIIGRFGQMCAVHAALPAVVHLAATYENNPGAGLVENVMAGGDSAARGMAAGMILGAHAGPGGVPGPWLSGMRAFERIRGLLETIG